MTRAIVRLPEAKAPAVATAGARGGVPGGDSKAAPPADDYSDKLLKLIPAEVIGVYTSMHAILENAQDTQRVVYLVVFLFGAFATYFYLRVVLKVADRRQVLVTVGAFCVWAYAIGFDTNDWWYNGTYAGLLLAAYTFIAPKLVAR